MNVARWMPHFTAVLADDMRRIDQVCHHNAAQLLCEVLVPGVIASVCVSLGCIGVCAIRLHQCVYH